MHLKSCQIRSELCLDAGVVHTLSQQGAQRRSCNSGSRFPFSVISTNTLLRSHMTNGSVSETPPQLKASPSVTLQPLPPPSGYENETLRFHQTQTEDTDAPLDIWTVIKPGHVREKIAIFASDGGRSSSVGDSECTSTSVIPDRTPALCSNNAAMAGLLRAVKAKGSWEENSSAKRRRRSGNKQNLQPDQRSHKPSPRRLDFDQLSGETVTVPEEELKVSVVEMVAFLEQRVSEQQPDSKPLLAIQRSSATITLSRAPPPEGRGEESDNIRVSDMVAKLESECLRRRAEGDLSRSNSLRRSVGRVLLATSDISPPCRQSSPVTSSSSQALSTGSETPVSSLTTPPSPDPAILPIPPSGEATLKNPNIQTPPSHSEEAEPLPGLLFLSPPLPALKTLPLSNPPPHDSGNQSKETVRVEGGREARRPSVSQDFLQMRQRLQQLLEPQPYLAVLPHHLLVKIFLLLPTQSLAALKCTCHYFKFIIDTYGVRPADSLWVSDPRYRHDPCKQCKKRYGRGDVSLCRWHHKPFCQALPYGPGYWMCCHAAHRDAPGCNVGLHDNRWVPVFHSINVPKYRRGQQDD